MIRGLALQQNNRQVVWITGASSGIGAALAKTYSQVGAKLLLTARNRQNLELTRSSLSAPEFAEIYPADVTSWEDMSHLMDKFDSLESFPDTIILNAGTYKPMSVADFSSDSIRDIMDLNFHSVALALELLLPRMKSRGTGHIAVVSSLAADKGFPFAGAYSASKCALVRLCESLQVELLDLGIHLSIVQPGFVSTPLTAKNKFPMPFMVGADDAASLIFKKLQKKHLSIRFPWQMSWIMRVISCLPGSLALKVNRWMAK
jgi:short-subunit dehydrogenase